MQNARMRVLLVVFFIAALAFQIGISRDAVVEVSTAYPTFASSPGQWLLLIFIQLVNPFLCLFLGFYVTIVRPQDRRAWLLLAVLISYSLVAFGTDVHDPILQWHTPLRHLALFYRTFAVFSWSLWMIVFALYFPERAPFDRRRPRAKWVFLGPWTALTVVIAAARFGYNEGFTSQTLARTVTVPLFSAGILIALAVLLAKLFTVKQPDSRRRLRVLFVGLTVSLVPPIGTEFIARDIFHKSTTQLLSPWVFVPDLSLLLLFQLTLAYVVVAQRAMDVRVIVRQSLQYGLARRGVTVLQVLVSIAAVFAIAAISGDLTFTQRVIVTALFVVAIFAGGLAARLLARWVDRRFFREAYNTERVLNHLAEDVRSIIDLQTLLDTVTTRIRDALHLELIAAFLEQDNVYRPACATGYGQNLDIEFPASSSLAAEIRSSNRSMIVAFDRPARWLERLPSLDASRLRQLEAELLLPLNRNNKLLGFFCLGRKRSEAPYSATDTNLLESVGAQTALAIENSRLTAAVASETAQREVIQRELDIAREVQQRLFPQDIPAMPGIEVAGYCRPALAVGGDYFDVIPLSGGRLGLAIGDVSGKGIPAALLMAGLRSALRGLTLQGATQLDQMMGRLNQLVYESSAVNRYATFFFAVYDPTTRRLNYVNAGHNAPFLIRASPNGNTETLRLHIGGPVVGLLKSVPYEEASISLGEGDLFVGYTDGMSEAMTGSEEEWGEERLLRALKQAQTSNPADILKTTFDSADAFTAGAPQHDDMTLLVMRAARL